MKLSTLRIWNYRNFNDSGDIPYHDLSIFVGENGSGKTSTIDALSLILDYSTPKPTFDDAIDPSKPIIVEGVFIVNPSGEDRTIDAYIMGGKLTLQYSYELESGVVTYSIKTTKYSDERFNSYKTIGAEELKNLVRQIGKQPGRTKPDNYIIINGYLDQAALPMQEGYIEIPWQLVSAYIPILQRFSSAEYRSPEAIVNKTLSTVYRSHFYEIDSESGKE